MPRKGQFKENVLLGDHGTWQEWSIGTASHPNAVLKIDTPDMIALRKRCGARIVAVAHHGNLYASFHEAGRAKKVHRIILNPPPGVLVDHRNHDCTDNRRANLRFATPHENGANSKLSKANTSGHVGVTWFRRDQKWMAQLKKNYKVRFLGYFTEKADAIAARKAAELEHFGEFAYPTSLDNKGVATC